MINYLFYAILAGIIVWRVILPSMELKSEKTLKKSVTPATPSAQPADGKGKKGRLMKYWWSIPLVLIVGAVVWGLLWGTAPSLEAPSLKTVWGGTKNYWLWIVVILAIPFFVLYAVQKPWAKALQWLLAVTALMLFVFFPVLVGIRGDETPNSHQRSEIPLASSPQSSWPKLVIPSGIGSESELIHVPPGTQLSVAGYKFRLYNVYQDKTRCAYENDCKIAPLAGVIAVNESADENILHYAYSKT